MVGTIRLGIIGTNVKSHGASCLHLPALLAGCDFEIAAVCTTRQQSAGEARERYGARLAFHDHREMVRSS